LDLIFIFLAPRADRHPDAIDRYVHPSQDRTIDEHHPLRSVISDIPPLPMAPLDTTSAPSDQFSIDALAFLSNSIDTYPIYGYFIMQIFSTNSIYFLVQHQPKRFYSVLIVFQVVMFL
jgi:hypothetical protein